MDSFLNLWAQSAHTTLGLFWTAFWAFGLGYLVSSMIQVFVTQARMKKSMGETGVKSMGLATFFGFISSSCSFAALSTTRALFAKGAGLVPSLAFLLASTNLVIELGIIISLFLSWQFVVGEYLGGVLLILLMALVVKLTLPENLEDSARKRAKKMEGDDEDQDIPDWKELIRSKEAWQKVSSKYIVEWLMVWKDVSIGFTIAGIIAVFVPQSFFQALFVGAGSKDPGFFDILIQSFIGPVAAFFTFIGSMGNIPLAAVLFSNGVSFAGIMAFIFSDLVVFPVLRIQAKYYGWKMALYILGVFLVILVGASVIMHYGFSALDILPDASSSKKVSERSFFSLNYTFFLNLLFTGFSVFTLFRFFKGKKGGHSGHDMGETNLGEKILFYLSLLSYLWLIIGMLLFAFH